MQLLRIDWNVIFTIVNLIVLYLGLRKFLIGPVTKVMDQRKQLIEGQMADARHVNEQANELKAQYEDALKQAHEESAQIVEKARKCEALGAEVVQLTVGPELFYSFLSIMEDTGYFNASLYSPFGIAGVETLGYEIATQCREKLGKDPDVVVCTNAGGGMVTGTARGLLKAGCKAEVVAASIDLTGLSMASDVDFNKKSCTTGHTGFGVPYATDPDHSDVPRSAARPLRYMDKYLTTTQGEVMYMTEMLANLEGIERGPAGNTALAAAFSYAQELPEDAIVVVSETEYTGAGKHIQPQLDFARDNGIDIKFGDPKDDKPGTNLILPANPDQA